VSRRVIIIIIIIIQVPGTRIKQPCVGTLTYPENVILCVSVQTKFRGICIIIIIFKNIIRLYDDDNDYNTTTSTSRSPTRDRTVSGDDTRAGSLFYNNHIIPSCSDQDRNPNKIRYNIIITAVVMINIIVIIRIYLSCIAFCSRVDILFDLFQYWFRSARDLILTHLQSSLHNNIIFTVALTRIYNIKHIVNFVSLNYYCYYTRFDHKTYETIHLQVITSV